MITDAIRNVLWGVLKLLLSVCNWMYELTVQVVTLDFSNMKLIMDFWLMMSLLILGLVSIRVYLIYIRKTSSEDEEFNGADILTRIAKIVIVTTICTPLFNIALALPNYTNNLFNKYVAYQVPMSPSTSIISTTAKTSVSGELKDMVSTDEIIDIKTIDENLNKEDANGYVYFIGYAELILCAVAAFLVFQQQAQIFVEAGCRIFINIYRFILGFIPISSIVEDNSTFGEWVSDIIADATTTSLLLIITNFAFCIMSSDKVASLNGIVRLSILFVELRAIQKIADMVAKYLHASNLKPDRGSGIMGFLAARTMMRAAGNIMKQIPGISGGLSDGAFNAAMQQGDNLINDVESLFNGNPISSGTNSYFASSGSSPALGSSAFSAGTSPFDENPINSQFSYGFASPKQPRYQAASAAQSDLQKNMNAFREHQNKVRFYYGMARRRGMGYAAGFAMANEGINHIFSKFESPFTNDNGQSGHIYNESQLTNDFTFSPLTNASQDESATNETSYKDGDWRDDDE